MNERLKKLAVQAGMEWDTHTWCWLANPPHLEKFAELVRQDERRCEMSKETKVNVNLQTYLEGETCYRPEPSKCYYSPCGKIGKCVKDIPDYDPRKPVETYKDVK